MTHRGRWHRRLDAVCSDPALLRLVLHPVVDVAAGRVAGYEVLSRFGSPVPTEEWFRAARALGRDADLDRVVLAAALERLPDLPPGTFLTVNASPTSLADPEVMAVLLAQDLTGVVLELTEHADCDPRDLVGPLTLLRARGALIALDDVGTGHSGLLRMAVVRPEILKVDLQLVRGLHQDLVKRSLVQFLGECAGRLDAWIIAEGVETADELEVLRGMGVPLVQGFLLARPGDDFAPLSAEAARLLNHPQVPGAVPAHARHAGDLARRTKTSRSVSGAVQAVQAESAPVVVVDAEDVPRVIVLPGQRPGERPRVEPVEVTLAPETPVSAVAARAVARPVPVRYDPLVCTDPAGRYVGVVGFEDVVLDLAAPTPAALASAHRVPWTVGAVGA
ncbi:EAL domain-containing protein (putative c-di-GMP-specific phosphodiesterase class I) [Kineococcus rhizosphaerae]|uniref:EAL domain-containing protein (Putative c-di-GMP-specific phosphodiesterase class I) n=1 Tax=Kineococcus rhizosphaerae TaxID=559628 RepID=A0A2T0RA67_9ACTN|nr:EAL domain-containing protein (putative c-di-GMP-specific phosphodiesterase class I) [Kineococcus rhizosphaerae]